MYVIGEIVDLQTALKLQPGAKSISSLHFTVHLVLSAFKYLLLPVYLQELYCARNTERKNPESYASVEVDHFILVDHVPLSPSNPQLNCAVTLLGTKHHHFTVKMCHCN